MEAVIRCTNLHCINCYVYKSLRNELENVDLNTTGGPRISWFLVPNGYHEMGGSWIPRTILSVKSQNGSKNFPKSPFFANFHEISIFESQHMIVRYIMTCLSCYLSQIWSFQGVFNEELIIHM